MSKYPELTHEINKIIALDIFKKKLINNIVKYYQNHNVTDSYLLNNIRRQMNNNFTNWFFNLNIKGKIKNFIPTAPFDIQENLNYLFKDKKIYKFFDFDQHLLIFKHKYIKKITEIIDITPKTDDKVTYILKTPSGHRTLLSVSHQQYKQLKDRYSGPLDKLDEYLSIILARYQFLGGLNNHLSIPPKIYDHLGVNFELFGTPLNTHCKYYCSPFYDYEKYFGSIGSFFDLKFKSGWTYGANPPFSADLIEKMAIKLLYQLRDCPNIEIYLTVPQWDHDFKGLEMIRTSPYLKYIKKLTRHRYPYYDFYREKYVPAINTYLMLLCNNNTVIDESYLDVWPTGPIATIRYV